jgi:hypothetical protein
MDVNAVLACCSCTDWRRDRVVARLAQFYLQSLSGKAPTPPTIAELTRGCCQEPRAVMTIPGAALIGNVKIIGE